jgi:hypothetical protein
MERNFMGQVDTENDVLSEDAGGQGENAKLVPVAESIRYRKRAQSAEKLSETLAEQLEQAKSSISEMALQLNDIQGEQKLTRKLAAAGAIDLEAALLIARARTKGSQDADLDACIEQLRKEKQYLFASSNIAVAKKTAGVKDRMTNSHTILGRAAKKASVTGNRTDLQEYLKLRRNFA